MANAPHNKDRPETKAVLRALEKGDMDALGNALSVRQRRFCEEYIVDYNGTAAAIRAGYSPNHPDRQAYQLLKQNRGVSTYIDYLSRTREQQIMSVNPEYVISKTVKIIEGEDAKNSDKLRGLEMIAKILGMFIEKKEISGPDGGAIQLQRISEDAQAFASQLRQLADRAQREEEKVVEIV